MGSPDRGIQELIHSLSATAKRMVNADRSTLWVLDCKNNEMWTVLPPAYSSWLEIRIEAGKGYIGFVTLTGDNPSRRVAA